MRALEYLARIILSVSAVLLLSEVAVRVLGIAPPLRPSTLYTSDDPSIPWKPAPHSSVVGGYGPGEYSYLHVHNSAGFRDREHPEGKAVDTCRILAVGDSYMYGAGAPYEQTFLVQLEHLLNTGRGEKKTEIIKAGIPRFFPKTERMLLEGYLPRYLPDGILIGFNPNDVGDTIAGIDAVKVGPTGILTSKEGAMLGRLGLFLYAQSSLFRVSWSLFVSQAIARGAGIPYERTLETGEGFNEVWNEIEAEYERMAALSAQYHAKLVIMGFPLKESWRGTARYPFDRLREWAHRRGIPFIDPLPSLQQQGSIEKFYWRVDGHMNGEGYTTVARVVAPSIREAICK
jgi:hypothetical protein